MARKHINIRAGFDLKGFSTSGQNLEREFKKTARKMQSIGKTLSMSLTAPIVGLAGLSVAAFNTQDKAVQKLSAAIRANGGDVEKSMQGYKDFASEIQKVTTVGDEATLALLGLAETLGAKNTKQATKDAIGLSKALGIDMQTALKMTVQAQEGNFTMLNRYVPALKGAKTETEKAAIANELFAKSFEIAEAEALAGIGPMEQMKNALGDLMEGFGEIITEAINPFVSKIKVMAERFQDLNPETKKTIVIVGSLVAAIGPLIMAIAAVSKAMAFFAANPVILTITAIIAAIGALVAAFLYVRNNLEAFKDLFSNAWVNIKNTFITVIQDMVKPFVRFAKMLGIPIDDGLDKYLEGFKSKTKEVRKEFQSFSEFVGGFIPEKPKPTNVGLDMDLDLNTGDGEDANNEPKQKSLKQLQSKLADIQFAGSQRLREISHEVAIMGMRDEEDIALERLRFAQESATREIDFEIEKLNKKSSLNADEKAQLENLQNEKKAITELHLREMEALELDSKDVILKREESALKKKNDLLQLENANAAATQEEYNKAEKEREENHLRALIALRKEYGKEVTDLEIQLAEKKFEIQKGANEKAESLAADLGMLITNQIQALVSGTVDAMSQFIEDAFSGVEGQQKDFGKAFMGILGKFMGDFGKAMVALGVAQKVLKTGIKNINPGVIIAGGIALAAAGAAITGLSKKGLNSSAGGGVDSSGGGNVNPGVTNIDADPIVMETRIEGNQLILVQNRSNSFRR